MWLFRQIKPSVEAYSLAQDEATERARAAAGVDRPSAHDMAELVDWSPEAVWRPAPGQESA